MFDSYLNGEPQDLGRVSRLNVDLARGASVKLGFPFGTIKLEGEEPTLTNIGTTCRIFYTEPEG